MDRNSVQKIQSEFTIPASHPSLPGHFPDAPIVPGVLLLDRIVQAAETALGRELDFLELPQVKFLEPLSPGENARIELEIEAIQLRFSVFREARLLASGLLRWTPET